MIINDLKDKSVRGISPVGYVRAGAMNRVAFAVGESSLAIKVRQEYR